MHVIGSRIFLECYASRLDKCSQNPKSHSLSNNPDHGTCIKTRQESMDWGIGWLERWLEIPSMARSCELGKKATERVSGRRSRGAGCARSGRTGSRFL